MANFTGGCLCGAVRYTIDTDPLPGRKLLCYCEDCQRQTGSAFLAALAFSADRVTLTGDLTTFTRPGGQTVDRHRRAAVAAEAPVHWLPSLAAWPGEGGQIAC